MTSREHTIVTVCSGSLSPEKGVVRSRMCPLKDGICHFSSLLSIVLAPCLWLVDGKVGLGTAGHLLSCLTAAAHHVRVLRWSAPVASQSFLTWGPCMCALCVQVPMWALNVTSQVPSILFSETGSLPGLELIN